MEDVTKNLSFAVHSTHARCDFHPHFGVYAWGTAYDKEEAADFLSPQTLVSNGRISSPTPWLAWTSHLMSKCCGQLSCKGFTIDGYLMHTVGKRENWIKYPGQATYIKHDRVRKVPAGSTTVESTSNPAPGFLEIAKDGDRTMDWVICLDVAQDIPAHLISGVFGSIANLAHEGLVFSWGPQSSDMHQRYARAVLEGHGFVMDTDLQAELRLFAGSSFKPHLRTNLMV